LHFNRSSSPSEWVDSVSIPAFCALAQGSKEVLLGSAIALQYDAMHYLLTTIELPIASQIQEASKALPYPGGVTTSLKPIPLYGLSQSAAQKK
jgi:hypothetical protein